MSRKIGEAAGLIWQHLDRHGKASVRMLSKKTGFSAPEVNRGIGWLAREYKVVIEKERKP